MSVRPRSGGVPVVLLFLLLVPMLALPGCASLGMPSADTLNKQLAVFEVSYENALNSAADLREAGKLSAGQVETLDELFNRIDKLRKRVYEELDAGAVEKAERAYSKAASMLTKVRSIIVPMEE